MQKNMHNFGDSHAFFFFFEDFGDDEPGAALTPDPHDV
jgi:hypothetical protein